MPRKDAVGATDATRSEPREDAAVPQRRRRRSAARRDRGASEVAAGHRARPHRNFVFAVHQVRACERHAERDDRDLLRFLRESARARRAGRLRTDRAMRARIRFPTRTSCPIRAEPVRAVAAGDARTLACGIVRLPRWRAYWAAMPAAAAPRDEELMLAYAAGDAAAFDTLYARHKGGVYRYLSTPVPPGRRRRRIVPGRMDEPDPGPREPTRRRPSSRPGCTGSRTTG